MTHRVFCPNCFCPCDVLAAVVTAPFATESLLPSEMVPVLKGRMDNSAASLPLHVSPLFFLHRTPADLLPRQDGVCAQGGGAVDQ